MRKENKGFRATNNRFLQSALESEGHQIYLRARILELMRDGPYKIRDVLSMLNLTVKYFKEFLCQDISFRNEVSLLDTRNREHQLYFGRPFYNRDHKNYEDKVSDVQDLLYDFDLPKRHSDE